MMNPWIENFLIPAGLTIITALAGYMVHLLKENRKLDDANAKGTMLLLRREIIKDHGKFVTEGAPMKSFDFEDVNEIHDAYKALGGNGLTDKMFEELKKKEIAKGEDR